MKLRHCEPKAKQSRLGKMDCFVAALLAMTVIGSAHAANVLPTLAPMAKTQNDPVEEMKAHYYETFRDLPPSRKCTPKDAKGSWREFAIFEAASTAETAAQNKEGRKYLAFGEYSRLLWLRTLSPLTRLDLNRAMSRTSLQFIVTSAGMLFVYQEGQLQASLLCLVSEKLEGKTRPATYKEGMLMLALPVEKDKSLTMTLYEPLK